MPTATRNSNLNCGPRVIGYCRVSTDKQRKTGHGLDAQRTALAAYFEANGYELLTITTGVVSGSKADQMHRRHMAIAAIESGVADVLLVRALDRATRDQLDAAELFKPAERNAWRLMDCDKADSGDPSQRLLADIRIAVARRPRPHRRRRRRDADWTKPQTAVRASICLASLLIHDGNDIKTVQARMRLGADDVGHLRALVA